MKTTNLLFTLMLTSLIISSCSKGGSGNNNNPPAVNQPLTVSFSKSQIAADGFEETTITVKDQTSTDVTSSSAIFINGSAIAGNTFYTSVAGTYQVKATKSGLESPVVNLTANNPGPSLFTQKAIAEFFTGTWCGICPGTIIPLDNYGNTHPNVINVGVHGPSGSNDPYQYIFDPQLRAAFSITGVPTVLLNRDSKWNQQTATLDALTQKRAPLGLALETSVSGNTISVRAKVKFDVTTSLPFKIVVMLAEDNLQYNQTNYGHFGLPNPIINFNHRNVLRAAATDIFGDAIPSNEQTKGNTWQKDYTVSAGSYVLGNCRIIAFVLYGDNTQNRKGVLNTQIVTVGQTKNFD